MLIQNTFIFPFTVLPESFYRFISLTLPSTKILRIMRPALIPSWSAGEFEEFPVFYDQGIVEKIQEIYRGYQDYAKIHGEEHLLETLSLAKEDSFWQESRFHLKTIIKSKNREEPSEELIANLEAALIIELARDLDQKDIELDEDLVKIDSLEDEFRKSLGLEKDENISELEEPIKITAETLPRRSYFGYLLKKRISSWLKLFMNNPTSLPPLLLCITEDIVEEIFDPVRTRVEKGGNEWIVKHHDIISMPNVLEFIEKDEFLKIKTECTTSERISFWEKLDEFLLNPQDSNLSEQMKEYSKRFSSILQTAVTSFHGMSDVKMPVIQLSVVYSPYVSLSEVIRYFTKKDTPLEYNNPVPVLLINEKS